MGIPEYFGWYTGLTDSVNYFLKVIIFNFCCLTVYLLQFFLQLTGILGSKGTQQHWVQTGNICCSLQKTFRQRSCVWVPGVRGLEYYLVPFHLSNVSSHILFKLSHFLKFGNLGVLRIWFLLFWIWFSLCILDW